MKPETSLTDLDERTLAFLAIVDCDPSDVRDIPPGRANYDHSRNSGPDEITQLLGEGPKPNHGSLVLYFGKHKDKKLDDIPRDYLIWLVSQPPMPNIPGKTRQSIERTKRKVLEYLDIPALRMSRQPSPRKPKKHRRPRRS